MNQQPIILSYSDINAYLSCRQRWDFSSSNRLGWRPTDKAKYLEFGGAWADAMAVFYNPETAKLGEGPRQVLTISRFVEAVEAQRQQALAYWEVLDPDQERDYEESLQLGQGMLDNYFDWAQRNDTFEPIGVEREFTVPITYSGEAMIWDGRPVLLYVRLDGLVRDKKYGGLWMMEDKTAKQSSPLYHLEVDLQTQLYSWALRQLSYEVKGLIYTVAYKHAPQPPKLNLDGAYSVDRRQYTTYRMFDRAMHEHRNRDGLHYRAKAGRYDEYLEYLKSEEHETRFFRRKSQPIDREALDNLDWRLYAIATEMLQNPLIIPHPSQLNCNNCYFRSVCSSRMSGRDWRVELTKSGAFIHRNQLPAREDKWIATHEDILASYQRT